MRERSKIHLNHEGRARCGHPRAGLFAVVESAATCGHCLNLAAGVHGIGNHNRGPDLPCGTMAAYRRHYRHGEKPCRSCRQAEVRYREDLRRAA